MSANRVDTLTRVLSATTIRRGLSACLAVSAGLAIGREEPAAVGARARRKPGSPCRRGIDCETLLCRHGRCQCPCEQINCHGVCRDPLADPAACGRCGNTCADPFGECVAGVCHPPTICTEQASSISCPASDCHCRDDVEGASRCVLAIVSVPEHFRCASTRECVTAYGRGNVCTDGERRCTPLCPGLAQ